MVKENAKKEGLLTGAILGASTILIPCGITQAMMALAVSSQSGLAGMMTLFAFTLGTVPMFIFFGLTAAKLNEKYSKLMTKIIAIVLLIVASYTIFYSVRLFGINLEGSSQVTPQQQNVSTDSVITVALTDKGYVPQRILVKKGVPVEMIVKNEEARGCIQSFVIPDLNVRETIPLGGQIKVSFTPQKVGKIGFTCSMGMYYGEFIVQ